MKTQQIIKNRLKNPDKQSIHIRFSKICGIWRIKRITNVGVVTGFKTKFKIRRSSYLGNSLS